MFVGSVVVGVVVVVVVAVVGLAAFCLTSGRWSGCHVWPAHTDWLAGVAGLNWGKSCPIESQLLASCCLERVSSLIWIMWRACPRLKMQVQVGGNSLAMTSMFTLPEVVLFGPPKPTGTHFHGLLPCRSIVVWAIICV